VLFLGGPGSAPDSGEQKMYIARCFTTAGQDPYATVPFRTATSEIRNPDGSVVFQAEGFEVPAEWSQVASDILAQKYFRKAGAPARLAPVAEQGIPPWLWRRTADEGGLAALAESARHGGETSARQVFDRMAGSGLHPLPAPPDTSSRESGKTSNFKLTHHRGDHSLNCGLLGLHHNNSLPPHRRSSDRKDLRAIPFRSCVCIAHCTGRHLEADCVACPASER